MILHDPPRNPTQDVSVSRIATRDHPVWDLYLIFRGFPSATARAEPEWWETKKRIGQSQEGSQEKEEIHGNQKCPLFFACDPPSSVETQGEVGSVSRKR